MGTRVPRFPLHLRGAAQDAASSKTNARKVAAMMDERFIIEVLLRVITLRPPVQYGPLPVKIPYVTLF
jgi:hypothetical protein